MRGRSAAALTFACLAACVPDYQFGGGGSDDGGPDATAPDARVDARADGAADAADAPVVLPQAPQVLLDAVGVETETGNAQQQHLVYAKNSGRWWLFYLDADPKSLKTRWSVDFVHWTDGAVLALPMAHSGEGRNFSVAYKAFGGVDVVHVATSLHEDPKRVVWDTRATIAGDAITFEAPILVHDLDDVGMPDAGPQGGPDCDPDGTGVTIARDGHVYVATAWVAVPGCCYCDANFATSTGVEDGTVGLGSLVQPLQHYSVGNTAHARQAVAVGAGNLIAGWEAADSDPTVTNTRWATKSAGQWSPGDTGDPTWNVFPPATPEAAQGRNDWSFCRIDDANIHAVRRKYVHDADGGLTESRAFEHYVWNGGGWTYKATVADDPGVPGSGVVLLTNGKNLLAAAISNDATGDVRYATFDGAWSGWRSIPGTAEARRWLSGTGCDDPDHPALLWTERGGPPYRVMGVPVAALIP